MYLIEQKCSSSSSSSSSMYFPPLPSIFTKVIKNKKREQAEPQGQALAKRTCRGEGETNKQKQFVIVKGRRAMQAGSGGHIGRVEKQLRRNLQVGGGRLKPLFRVTSRF